MNEYFYLVHGGPGSGRYPLGSGERPYQKYEGSGRRIGSISGYIRSRQEKKELKKRTKEERRQKELDKDKERVLKKGTAREVLKYKGELSNAELQNAVIRLNLESQLRSLSKLEMKSAINTVNDVVKTVKTGTEWIKTGTDAYNTVASIYNTLPNGQKNPLKKIR